MSSSALENPDPDLAAGTIVGEYRVDEKLGRGAFGTVFRASHPVIGKLAAIKVLARKYSVDPEMVDRFVTEARAVNQIRHHNIIDIFAFGTLPDGRAYYVMELLEGETLKLRLRRGRMTLAEALPILRAIGRALDAAHAKGIAHRDIKPDNVFLAIDTEGEMHAKLLDFGIAKLLGNDQRSPHKTETGVAMGTAFYMSPEQCRGRNIDHRTDYYAFGAVAYEMLTGVVPLDADDYFAVLMRQVSDEPVPPSTHAPELPPAIDEAVLWMLRKDPAQRPPNLATVVRQLEAASGLPLTTSAITARPRESNAATAPTMIAQPPRSRAPVIALGALAVIVGATAAFLALTHGTAKPPAPTALAAAPTTLAPTAPTAPAPTAPAPATAGSATAPSPSPAAPATITLHVSGPPPHTTAALTNGHPLGTVPGDLAIPAGTAAIEILFQHPGYALARVQVVPDHDAPLSVAMRGLPRAPADPHSIENPFHGAPDATP